MGFKKKIKLSLINLNKIFPFKFSLIFILGKFTFTKCINIILKMFILPFL